MHQTHYKLLDSSVFKSFFNDINSDSLIGNRLLLVVMEQLEAFSTQPDINMIGLN